jgi:hypothetical protein
VGKYFSASDLFGLGMFRSGFSLKRKGKASEMGRYFSPDITPFFN